MNYLEQLKLAIEESKSREDYNNMEELGTILIESLHDTVMDVTNNNLEIGQFILPDNKDDYLLYVDMHPDFLEVAIFENVLPDDIELNISTEHNRDIIYDFDLDDHIIYKLEVTFDDEEVEYVTESFEDNISDDGLFYGILNFVEEKLNLEDNCDCEDGYEDESDEKCPCGCSIEEDDEELINTLEPFFELIFNEIIEDLEDELGDDILEKISDKLDEEEISDILEEIVEVIEEDDHYTVSINLTRFVELMEHILD